MVAEEAARLAGKENILVEMRTEIGQVKGKKKGPKPKGAALATKGGNAMETALRAASDSSGLLWEGTGTGLSPEDKIELDLALGGAYPALQGLDPDFDLQDDEDFQDDILEDDQTTDKFGFPPSPSRQGPSRESTDPLQSLSTHTPLAQDAFTIASSPFDPVAAPMSDVFATPAGPGTRNPLAHIDPSIANSIFFNQKQPITAFTADESFECLCSSSRA